MDNNNPILVILRITTTDDTEKWCYIKDLTKAGQYDTLTYYTDIGQISNSRNFRRHDVPEIEFRFDTARNVLLEYAREIYPDAQYIFLDTDEVLVERHREPYQIGMYRIDIASPHITALGSKLDLRQVKRGISSYDTGRYERAIHEMYGANSPTEYLSNYYIENFGYDISMEEMKLKCRRNIKLLEESWAEYPTPNTIIYLVQTYRVLDDVVNANQYLKFLKDIFPEAYREVETMLNKQKEIK